jgi:hypothetical protein
MLQLEHMCQSSQPLLLVYRHERSIVLSVFGRFLRDITCT